MEVARVHQYLRTDGTLGGSGRRPDPKRLYEDGVLYALKKGPRQSDDRHWVVRRISLEFLPSQAHS